MKELTQERLKELFHYDPETGDFTWLVSKGKAKAGSIAGSLKQDGYIIIQINKKQYQAHRLAFLYMDGKFPEKGFQVDHINHNRKDNRWVNLRLVTIQENSRNQSIPKDNTSGHLGVYLNKRDDKLRSRIVVDGERINLGSFDNLEDAISARKAAEIKYGFHRNHGKQN